jgi:hypothetical protein
VGLDAEHRELVAVRAALAAVAAALMAAGAAAAECRLAMTIGMDVSASIDAREHALQRQGLAWALADPDVIDAFLALDGTAMLQVYEWSGRARQTVILDWTPIAGQADLVRAADLLRVAPRADHEFPTAVGAALVFAARQLERTPCAEGMVNLSGDGENNDGVQPRVVRHELGFAGVTINGLVVGGNLERLRRYYEEHVMHGRGSFVEVAISFEDFAEAMRRKLLRELGPVAAAS